MEISFPEMTSHWKTSITEPIFKWNKQFNNTLRKVEMYVSVIVLKKGMNSLIWKEEFQWKFGALAWNLVEK